MGCRINGLIDDGDHWHSCAPCLRSRLDNVQDALEDVQRQCETESTLRLLAEAEVSHLRSQLAESRRDIEAWKKLLSLVRSQHVGID